MQCAGIYENGPGKRFVRCRVCRAIDFERNEGDSCNRDEVCATCGGDLFFVGVHGVRWIVRCRSCGQTFTRGAA